MSLSFSSPTRTKRGRFPPTPTPTPTPTNDNGNGNGNDNNDDDEEEFHTPGEKPFTPLSNATLLGQLNQYVGSSSENEGDVSSRNPPDQPLLSSVLSESEPEHVHVHQSNSRIQYQHLYVLPVLLLEFLAIALTRAVLPSILIEQYGSNVYVVLGGADCVRGILAFFACPLFGKLSDVLGRKICLFVTVLGSCAPVCSLAFFTWDDDTITTHTFLNETATIATSGSSTSDSSAEFSYSSPPHAIPVFIVLLSLSGIFSSTFPLVFAYISDSVQERNERVTAYGLALATFGLSFTIGPMAGGYLANSKTDYVFQCTLGLTLLDLLYIYAILPESITPRISVFPNRDANRSSDDSSSASITTRAMLLQVANSISWNPWDSIRLVLHDPFLRKVGQVAFFYYTGLWAVLSTLSLYAVQHFRMTPQMLGELMSALGLSTMVAEAVLVRILVPLIGEKRAIRIGLVSFGLQCFVLGAANESWQLFFCVGLSLLGNLVYPSLSSLISGIVEPENVGEALGAINGIKALTEGLGPLLFGTLMTFSEHTKYPGSPYWLAGIFVFVAHHMAAKLPANSEPSLGSSFSSTDKHSPHHMSSPPEKEYIHELEFKRRYPSRSARRKDASVIDAYKQGVDDDDDCLASMFPTPIRDEEDEEYQGLLSEVDEDSDEWEEIDAAAATADVNANENETIEVHDNEEDLSFARKPLQR